MDKNARFETRALVLANVVLLLGLALALALFTPGCALTPGGRRVAAWHAAQWAKDVGCSAQCERDYPTMTVAASSPLSGVSMSRSDGSQCVCLVDGHWHRDIRRNVSQSGAGGLAGIR